MILLTPKMSSDISIGEDIDSLPVVPKVDVAEEEAKPAPKKEKNAPITKPEENVDPDSDLPF